jgi:hypothetical protein
LQSALRGARTVELRRRPEDLVNEPAVHSEPTPSRVAKIAAIRNRVIRNLEITECYADLSAAMRARTGDFANWCTFATWASLQAGSTIRGEDLLERFERRLGRRSWLVAPLQSLNRKLLQRGFLQPETRLGRLVATVHTPVDAFERASEAVAAGNLKVFDEIAQAFARFLSLVPLEAREDSAEFLAFAATLRPGGPPDGQDYLREAFAHYQQQRQEARVADRMAWILLANLKIGLHEQTRLQPQIAAAVDAPLITAADLGTRLLHILLPGTRGWSRRVELPVATLLGQLGLVVRRTAIRLTREVVTESMMVLALPGRVLALGQNLDAPVPEAFHRVANPTVASFIAEHDPCLPGVSECGASDWCDLRQRMHYILHLFRAYAHESALFSRPFTSQQVAQFRSDVVPAGEL